MHNQAYEWLKTIRAQSEHRAPVLEIGSININGSARDIWGQLNPYVGVDIVAGAGVDYVVDFSDWNVISNRAAHPGLHHQFRTIICTEVLEHVDPNRIVPAMFPYMGDICHVIITAASIKRQSHSADGAPELKPGEYYKNVTPTLLHSVLHDVPLYLKLNACSVILTTDKTDVYAHAIYERVL